MAGPLLVLVPGLLCDDSVWQPQIDGLADRAGCWVAPNEGHDSLPALATELLRQAPAERFALAGHSMGGRIALEVMRQAPERVERLALLDTGWQPRPSGEAGETERRQRLALLDAARASGMSEVARRWLPGMVRPAAHGTAGYARMQAMVERRKPAQFAAQVRALLDRPDASELLARIACPTLVLCGDQDQWSPPDRHTAMAALIRRSRLVLVPDCGHMSTLEQPAAVTAALADWLDAPAPPC